MTAGPRLTRALIQAGELAPAWEAALAKAPRCLFLPDLMWPLDPDRGGYAVVDKAEDPEAWERWASADVPIVTQWDDGNHMGREPGETPTSSSSTPTLVAQMLSDLDVHPGQRVLDVGAGTGWTTALLAARVGAGNVVGVEVDPRVAEGARANLRRAGFDPPVVTRDGSEGWAPGSPYDRVQVTYAVHGVSPAWVSQVRLGGVIVVPWGTPFTNLNAVARLSVTADGIASGRFTRPVEFMLSRPERMSWPVHEDYLPPGGWPADTRESVTTVVRDELWGSLNSVAEFVLGVQVPHVVHTEETDADGTLLTVLYSTSCRSWSVVFFRPDDRTGGPLVYQGGKRDLWDEVERAYRWWEDAGRPPHARFGLTVSAEKQRVWYDHPASEHAWDVPL